MRNVYLHGSLGERFGRVFELDVQTAGEAIRALSANFSDFMSVIRDGAWHVVRGKTVNTGFDLDEQGVSELNLGKGDLHIVPYIAGSKRGGVLKIILGAVLIGAAFFLTAGSGLGAAIGASGGLLGGITGTQVALFGAVMAVAGVSQLLTPEESSSDSNENSFTMSGPGNTYEQGAPVPLVYGHVITGGILVSGGIDIERVAVSGSGGGSVGGKK